MSRAPVPEATIYEDGNFRSGKGNVGEESRRDLHMQPVSGAKRVEDFPKPEFWQGVSPFPAAQRGTAVCHNPLKTGAHRV